MVVPSYQSQLLGPLSGLSHGFFSRQGGVSDGIFSSLNCSQFSTDKLLSVEQNRDRVAKQLRARVLVTNRQVHGTSVRVLSGGDSLDTVVKADGLVTREPGIGIGALGADCAPVLFADASAAIVGVAHAGWQGAVDGITDSVIDQMCRLGARVESLYCAIGPAIQLPSYEVGEKFMDMFLSRSPVASEQCFAPDKESGNQHFDLPRYIEIRLRALNVVRIDRLEHDTYADSRRFFSYRRSCHLKQETYGRQVGAICLL